MCFNMFEFFLKKKFFSFAFQGNVMRKMSSLSLPQLRLPSSVRTRFWRKKSVTISDLDPQYRVTYLGNVLTGWAKGRESWVFLRFQQLFV